MYTPWISQIVPGVYLRPKPLWNNTERGPRHLEVPTEILDVRAQKGCESGVMLKVQLKGGVMTWLDAGWFCKPCSKYPLTQDVKMSGNAA